MKMEDRSFHQTHLWTDWYAWHPVFAHGDGIFWLEYLCRRRSEQGGWEYRPLRTPDEKEQEDIRREI